MILNRVNRKEIDRQKGVPESGVLRTTQERKIFIWTEVYVVLVKLNKR